MWTVYILKCADDTYYTGISNNLSARLQAHNDGKGAKYTRGRGPFELVYHEQHASRSVATKREIEIKKLKRNEKIALSREYSLSFKTTKPLK